MASKERTQTRFINEGKVKINRINHIDAMGRQHGDSAIGTHVKKDAYLEINEEGGMSVMGDVPQGLGDIAKMYAAKSSKKKKKGKKRKRAKEETSEGEEVAKKMVKEVATCQAREDRQSEQPSEKVSFKVKVTTSDDKVSRHFTMRDDTKLQTVINDIVSNLRKEHGKIYDISLTKGGQTFEGNVTIKEAGVKQNDELHAFESVSVESSRSNVSIRAHHT